MIEPVFEAIQEWLATRAAHQKFPDQPATSDALCDDIVNAAKVARTKRLEEGLKNRKPIDESLPDAAALKIIREGAEGIVRAEIDAYRILSASQFYYQPMARHLSSEALGEILDKHEVFHSSWRVLRQTPHQVVAAMPASCERDVEVKNGISAIKRRLEMAR